MKSLPRLCAVALFASGCLPGAASAPAPANPALVDDVAGARLLLEQQRTAARVASQEPAHRRASRLIQLGLFQDADSLLAGAPRTTEVVLAQAELRFHQYRFDYARALVEAVQEQQPGNRGARRLAMRLAVQAWQLDWAQEQAEPLLRRGRRDPEAGILLGRILLLRADRDGALEWARRVQTWRGGEADGHRLEAAVHLASNRPAAAEASLQRALALDPLDADARFAYGYALQRRGTPALLTAVRAQWDLALELDPLHLQTHWYLGNGPLPATAAAGEALADGEVLTALAPADSLMANGDLDGAIALVRGVEAAYPASVLPALWRGSLFHVQGTHIDPASLDSAQVAFRTVLSREPVNGPAHDGVAAVLRQRQFRALAAFDSLEAAIALAPLPESAALREVFPELALYPGERVDRMVAQQLGPYVAFLPMVRRLGEQVRLPALHHPATGNGLDRSERGADRAGAARPDPGGVDEGAAPSVGIEAVERGSHLDRSTLLNEFVHLVHANLLTEAQQRSVGELYRAAVDEERTLDYRAASSEQEFFARAVEAYLAPVRVHPLDPGSLNTRADLTRADPATYAFVEALTAELERTLGGDAGGLRSNRAQMYVELARRIREPGRRRADLAAAAVLLDSALIHDSGYLPAMVEYALLEGERGRLSRAHEWIGVAAGIEPGYTPLLAARAALLGLEEDAIPGVEDSRIGLLRQAADRETDPQLRADYVRDVWELQEALGWLPEAISTAEQYAASAPASSPPLAAARERAVLAVLRMRIRAGYAEEAVNGLRERVAADPYAVLVVGLLADALVLAGQEAEAQRVLERARELLTATGGAHRDIDVRLAELALAAGDTMATMALLEPHLAGASHRERGPDGRLARLLISLGQSTEAQRQLVALAPAREPAARAELAFTRGWISAWRGDSATAERLYREAIAGDPYHLQARVALVRLLRGLGRAEEARAVVDSAATLPLPLGPAFAAQLAERRAARVWPLPRARPAGAAGWR